MTVNIFLYFCSPSNDKDNVYIFSVTYNDNDFLKRKSQVFIHEYLYSKTHTYIYRFQFLVTKPVLFVDVE